MYSFEHTWTYEKILDDIYIDRCPFCEKENVLLSLKIKDLEKIRAGVKKRTVLPCCHGIFTIVQVDDDYFYLEQKVRKTS